MLANCEAKIRTCISLNLHGGFEKGCFDKLAVCLFVFLNAVREPSKETGGVGEREPKKPGKNLLQKKKKKTFCRRKYLVGEKRGWCDGSFRANTQCRKRHGSPPPSAGGVHTLDCNPPHSNCLKEGCIYLELS